MVLDDISTVPMSNEVLEQSLSSDAGRLQRLSHRMNSACPQTVSREANTVEARKRGSNQGKRATQKSANTEPGVSAMSDDESAHRSFGVVVQQDDNSRSKRRKLGDAAECSSPANPVFDVTSPETKDRGDACEDMTPRQPVTERFGLHDFKLKPCTSKDGCSLPLSPTCGNSRPAAGDSDTRTAGCGRLKGQKGIGDFFKRSRASEANSHELPFDPEDRTPHACATSERLVLSDLPASAPPHRRSSDSASPPFLLKPVGRAASAQRPERSAADAPETGAAAAARREHALTREVEVIKAEKAMLQGQLEGEQKLRVQVQQELDKARAEVVEVTAQRDDARAKLSVECARYAEATKQRMKAQEDLVKKLARRELELLNMRIQINNQRLGVVVRKSGALGDAPSECFEPAFEFHQLQAKLTEVEVQKMMVEAKRKELKSTAKQSTSASGGEPSPGSCIAYQEESLKSKAESLMREEKAIMADRQRLLVQQMQHIKDVQLKRSTDESAYKEHRVMIDRYVLMALFGKGGFAEVHRAYDLHTSREVAVKIHAVDHRVPAEQKEYVRRAIREVTIQEALRHPRIVHLHHVFQINDNSFAIVMEACRGGDLQSYLAARPNKQLPEKEAKSIIAQVFDGLAYLNTDLVLPHGPAPDRGANRVIHYDLKPANILFDDYGSVKISDFGLSKLLDATAGGSSVELTSPGAGTLFYQPPECQMPGPAGRAPQISNKVDVWAAGVIFYEMLYGKRPFHTGVSQNAIASGGLLLGVTEVRFDAKPAVSQEAKDFIRRCLTYSHTARPDVLAAANDPYLKTGKERSRRQSTPAVPPPTETLHLPATEWQSMHAAASAAAAAASPAASTYMI